MLYPIQDADYGDDAVSDPGFGGCTDLIVEMVYSYLISYLILLGQQGLQVSHLAQPSGARKTKKRVVDKTRTTGAACPRVCTCAMRLG